MERIDPGTEAAGLKEFWSQKVIGQANGNLFKVAKGIGSTTWHQHDDQEETFIVLKGSITVQLRTGDVDLGEGDMFIVPRGVEHCPKADEEVHLLVVGPDVTSNEAGGKPDWSYTKSGPEEEGA